MVFLIYEAIFRRPPSEKVVVPLTFAGLFLILCLMVFATAMDVQKLWPF